MSEASEIYRKRRSLGELYRSSFDNCRSMNKNKNYTLFTFIDKSTIKITWIDVEVTDECGTRNYKYEDYSLPDT